MQPRKLNKANIQDILGLTSMQEGMLMHFRRDPNNKQYFEQLSLTLTGQVDQNMIKKAWNFVIENNEMLRTVFHWEKLEKPIQIVLKQHLISFAEHDISRIDRVEKNLAVQKIKKQDLEKQIDITTEPFRITIIKWDHTTHEMILTYHHILYDGWSNGILLKEFIEACNYLSEGKKPIRLEKNKFKEFVKWYQKQDQSKHESYWKKYFEGYDPTPGLTATFTTNRINSVEKDGIKNLSCTLSKEFTEGIYDFCKKEKLTVATLLYATWGTLLQRYTNSNDIVFGSTVSGRNADVLGIEDMVGLFINTLPLRILTSVNESVSQLLNRVDLMMQERDEYQHTPLVEIKSYSNLHNKEELFDTLVVIENYPLDQVIRDKKNCVQIEKYSMFEKTNYKLTLTIIEFDGLILDFSYDQSTFTHHVVSKMAEHFENIVASMIDNPTMKLSQIDLLTPEEREQILVEFNNTRVDLPTIKTIHQLFEEQVEKTPDNIAVVFEEMKLTYQEINQKANQLARRLRKQGVEPGNIVGLLMERSPKLIIGMLGVLKAGAAYLPIDPKYPADRIFYMLEDSGAKVVCTQSDLTQKGKINQEVFLLDDETLYQGDSSNLENLNQEEDLIYIIYTSGSTGKPKGVMVPHKGVVNYITWAAKCYVQEENADFPLYTSISFDLTVTSIYTPLLTGNRVIIYGEKENQLSIERVFNENQVEIVKLTPAHLRVLKEKVCKQSKVKRLIVGGEQLETGLAYQIYQNFGGRVEIYNEYGPTEASVGCMIYRYDPVQDWRIAVPIGRPVDNMKIYLLDRFGNPVSENVIGELCISGSGLAKGYLNQTELTAEKFISNPLDPTEKLYRSGDLARRLPSGNIEFLGRIDHQVKIRGYRIELEEIEHELLNHPVVKEAIVLPKKDQMGNKYLCAYIIIDFQLTSGKGLTVTEMREYLLQELPDYMVPSYYVQLDQMPLTPNGKINRKALPEPDGTMVTGADYEAPRNVTEEKLAGIWHDVLGVDTFGINDDFFDLGGHSLKATSLVAKIHKELNIEIPLSVMFKIPTIKGLSAYLKTVEKRIYTEIQPVEEKEYYEMSSAQRRLFTLQQFDADSTSYNIPAALSLTGELYKERLQEVFQNLIKRHESLRTSFSFQDEKLLQKIHKEVEFELEYTEISDFQAMARLIQEFIRPFDLSKAPLLRARLIKVCHNQHILLTDMHHIISDGVSTDILIKEFTKLYEGQTLPELRLQFKDFAGWQNEFFASDQIKKQKAYWLETFKGDIPILNMPTDFSRPAIQSFEGDRISFELSEELTEKLREITKETGSTMFMLLLAAINLLLAKYSGQEEIIVGTPIAGRPHADLEKIMGMFVNTLAMKNNPMRNKTFREFLKEVKENALQAYENQDYQFEELVENLQIPRNLSRNPLFDVVFAMQNMDISQLHIEDVSIEPYDFENRIAKFDLTFTAVEVAHRIGLSIEYCTKLFKKSTIEKLYRHFVHILEGITGDMDIRIGHIEIVTEEEKEQILFEYNDTKADYPQEKTIHMLFEEQVDRIPDQIALICEEVQLTYQELNDQANRLARSLRKMGVRNDDLVGVVLDRSPEMIIAALAILKAGGAYLPIDPEYPQDRINYTLNDSGTKIVLTSKKYASKVDFAGEKVYLDDQEVYSTESANLEIVNLPDDLAYVIYTSGTTGKPKGAMVEHKNVVRLMFNEKMQFNFTENDIWTMFHSFCFDFSVWEMYGALLYGGKLVIVPKPIAQDPQEYLKLLKSEKVTILNQTPTAFYNLVHEEVKKSDQELDVRYVIFGGEALKPIMLKDWRKKYPETKLINMYGITETTVHVTYKEITEYEIEQNISNIGKPIPTLTTYIMNPDLRLVPVGVAGELCVGGEGVCRGYINRPELTAKKFVDNPYQRGERLYRSGDLIKMLPDGEMEYLGRIDHQVKIRGHRIELGEIENRLLMHPTVKETVVLVKDDQNGSKYLCAYVVVDQQALGEQKLTILELREYISKDLPEYMIPSYFIQLDCIPLTSNGKVDRKALPEPDGNVRSGTEYEAPENETEEKLVNLWQEVLVIESIGVRDNFFTLGGDSIKALRLISAINTRFDQELQIRSIYEFPTIKEFVVCLNDQDHKLGLQIEKARAQVASIQKAILSDPDQAKKLPADLEDMYPLSDIEQGMIYHYLKSPEEAIYHDQLLYMMKDEKVDYVAFSKAIQMMTEKHPILRTSFSLQDFDTPVQIVHQSFESDLEYIDLKSLTKQEQDDFVNQYLKKDRKSPFQLSRPLWRIRMFMIDEQSFIFALICHHAILDGWSVASYVTELANLYYKLKEPETTEFIPEKLKHSYKDFVIEQISIKQNQDIKNYWKEELCDYKKFDLRQNVTNQSNISGAKTLEYALEKELVAQLKTIAQTHHTGLKTICFTAYACMINMLSYEEDLVVGLVEHNRPMCEDGDQILGCFLNTLPFRLTFAKGMKWKELLAYVHDKMTELKLYGKLPLVEILEALGENPVYDNPLFDTFFNFIDFHIINDVNNELINENLNELAIDSYARTNTLLDFTVYNMFGSCKVAMTYTDDLFTDQEASKLLQYFTNALYQVTTAPDNTIDKMDLMTTEEKEQLLFTFNDTKADYPTSKMIHLLFEEQVEKTPDNVAVVYEGKQLTYREINEKANQLARFLRSKGVGPDRLVGLMVERSHEMMVGILGILKAGGAYLPLDSEYPLDRIEYILADSKTGILLTHSRFADKVSFFDGETICFENDSICINDTTNLNTLGSTSNLAYVIYTSGSTGKPKGVVIEHCSVVNRLFALQEKYPFSAEDAFLLKTTYMFDVSVAELFGWFMGGGRLVMLGVGAEKDQTKILNVVEQNRITHINFVPSIFNIFLNLLKENELSRIHSLKYVMIAGEAIPKELVNKINSLNLPTRFENLYGPTEATIYTTTYDLRKPIYSMNVPIGRPMPNTQVQIVNQHGCLQPIGVPGELCIYGQGLAREYLNRPDLTTEKFILNPVKYVGRMYKSGDLARWLPDGNIEFLGRIDHQVKIRGYRIELGEIENQLLRYEKIKEAVVMAKEDQSGDKYICAYIVGEEKLTVSEVREFLLRGLPDYMVPSHFVQLEKMPLTPNGKVNRKGLPEPDGKFLTGAKYEAPRNELERKLVEIWQEVLGIDKVGINDSFFDLGGHSLKVTSLVAKIHKELNLEVSLREIFKIPTIKDLSEYLKSVESSIYSEIQPIEEKDSYELSSGQKRIYTLQQLEQESTAYNMPGVMEVDGALDQAKLETSFKKLIERHELFRTSFELGEEGPIQKVHQEIPFEIEYLEIAGQDEIDQSIKSFIRVFDLTRAPLLRVGLISMGTNGKYLLIFDMHHMISDGTSIGILIKEFASLYAGQELPELRIQYKDYAAWQNMLFQSDRVKKQEKYWMERFKGNIPVLNLPTDEPRPEVKSFTGDRISLEIGSKLTERLRSQSKESGCTLYMVMLAAYNVLLSRYSGQDDIVVGTPIAGRPHADLENIMGMFVNTLALRNQPQGGKTFEEFLEEVKENTLKAYENQDYQFEELVMKLGISPNASRNPLFDVFMNMIDVNIDEVKVDQLIFKPYQFESKIAKFELSFIIEDHNETLGLTLVYNSNLYRKSTIEVLANCYFKILTSVVENPSLKISQIEMFDGMEKNNKPQVSSAIDDFDEDFDF